MKAQTLAILNLADTAYPGGREELLSDLLPLLTNRKFFTMKDLAERYAVSLTCIKKWRQDGKLTNSVHLTDGAVRFTLADLENFEKLTGKKEEE